MSDGRHATAAIDTAPGRRASEGRRRRRGVVGYLIGLGLAVLLTGDLVLYRAAPISSGARAFPWRWSCWRSRRWACIWCSSCTSPPGPDNTNNVMALAFGVLIVILVIGGSLWIMAQSQPQHDADGSDDADAALVRRMSWRNESRRPELSSVSTGVAQ